MLRYCYNYDDEISPTDVLPFRENLLPLREDLLPLRERVLPISSRPSYGRKPCYDFYCPEEEALYEKLIKHCGRCVDDKKCELHFTKEEACEIAKLLGVNINSPCFDLDQFLMGLNVELEHGTISPGTNITNNDPIMTGKIALAHLNEIPDYYTRLARMRKEAREYWRRVKNSI
jgi:hypothetical protein